MYFIFTVLIVHCIIKNECSHFQSLVMIHIKSFQNQESDPKIWHHLVTKGEADVLEVGLIC